MFSNNNVNMKKHICDFMVETLQSCELFTTVYGVDFVSDRLERSMVYCYSDLKDPLKGLAEYDTWEGILRIYRSGNSIETEGKENWYRTE